MTKTLKLILTDHWFDEIKSGRKTHEYRRATIFWTKRILKTFSISFVIGGQAKYETKDCFVELQKAYRKNPEKMTFKVKSVTWCDTGIYTDLNVPTPVFDIELGERVK